ncbi:GvpL/GvpF family gas vesicle protein [Streptomyces sp. NPDC047117]|uniref:GvpL/GvpF family gas vesicle protein n=1 Tax=Streptomyces sp. NPDC047117 TaxID=3155379 RepID=UPI0033D4DD17
MTPETSGALMDATATYVFAVCRRLDPTALTGLSGLSGLVDGFPVRALTFGPLTAIVQDVPADEFTEEAWHQRLSDRQELERCARAHHEVVTAVTAAGPTAPLALATLYQGDERARAALGKDTERFTAALDRIEGHAEWGVKVYLPATAPEPTGGAPEPPRSGSGRAAGAGRAYLERKRGMHQARERHHDRTLQTAEDIDAELRNWASASQRLRTHGQEVTGERNRVQILNAAYLVAGRRERELADAVEGLRGRTGAQIELSGPWAPYSFVGEV